MTKKELEDREIKLEAVIHAYHVLIGNFLEKFPIAIPSTMKLEEYSNALLNAAEVRDGIEELVDFGIEYEEAP